MSTTTTWRQQDGGEVGKEPMRFTIRWDAGMGCYRVSVPNLSGPLQVVPAEAYDALRGALALLVGTADEARKRSWVDVQTVREFAAALEDARQMIASDGQEG